jgi:hypothetical protein
VVGLWNELAQTGALFTVGNGEEEDVRSNAFQVMSNGDAQVAGKLIVDGVDLLALVLNLQAQVDSLQQQVDLLEGN